MKTAAQKIPLSLWIGSFSFLAYAGCYLGKNILSAVMPQMVQETVVSRDQLGMMGSALLLSYGIGQLFNGLIGDRFQTKSMVAGGLVIAGITVLAFPYCPASRGSMALWGLCGFACSMLWGPISKLAGEHASPKAGKIILTFMTIASVVGTAATYLLAVLSTIGQNWRIGFFGAGALLLLSAIAWWVAIDFLTRRGRLKAHETMAGIQGKNRWNTIFSRTFFG